MTSQDRFEAWATEHLPTLYLTKTDQGTYESTATGNFFAVWSARDGEIERLRQALTDIFNHVEGNTECLVRDLVNWGTPRINPNDFYDECEQIKEIAITGLHPDAEKGEQS